MKRLALIFALFLCVVVAILVVRRQTRHWPSQLSQTKLDRRGMALLEALGRHWPPSVEGYDAFQRRLRTAGHCESTQPIPFATTLSFEPKTPATLVIKCADSVGGESRLMTVVPSTFRIDRRVGHPLTLRLSRGNVLLSILKGEVKLDVNSSELSFSSATDSGCPIAISLVDGSIQVATSNCRLRVALPTEAVGNTFTTPVTFIAQVDATIELPGLTMKAGDMAVLAPSGLRLRSTNGKLIE